MKVTVDLSEREVDSLKLFIPNTEYLVLKKVRDAIKSAESLRTAKNHKENIRKPNPNLKTKKALDKALQSEYDKSKSLINCILILRVNRGLGLSEAKEYVEKVVRR